MVPRSQSHAGFLPPSRLWDPPGVAKDWGTLSICSAPPLPMVALRLLGGAPESGAAGSLMGPATGDMGTSLGPQGETGSRRGRSSGGRWRGAGQGPRTCCLSVSASLSLHLWRAPQSQAAPHPRRPCLQRTLLEPWGGGPVGVYGDSTSRDEDGGQDSVGPLGPVHPSSGLGILKEVGVGGTTAPQSGREGDRVRRQAS